jgi:hypothetical protein
MNQNNQMNQDNNKLTLRKAEYGHVSDVTKVNERYIVFKGTRLLDHHGSTVVSVYMADVQTGEIKLVTDWESNSKGEVAFSPMICKDKLLFLGGAAEVPGGQWMDRCALYCFNMSTDLVWRCEVKGASRKSHRTMRVQVEGVDMSTSGEVSIKVMTGLANECGIDASSYWWWCERATCTIRVEESGEMHYMSTNANACQRKVLREDDDKITVNTNALAKCVVVD